MLPMPRRSRSRASRRAKSGAPGRRSTACSRAAEDVGELILLRRMVAWHTGDWESARGLAVEADRIAPDPGDLADLRGMSAYLDGGWEQHSRHQPMHVWDSAELASRVFDAYRCATEYVLTAGDRYDRVAGFAKRLRGAGAPGRCSPRGSVRRHRAGQDGAVHGQPRGRARTSSTQPRLSEVGAVGGDSTVPMRLGEALLHLGDGSGARAQLEGRSNSRTCRPSPSICCFSSTACCWRYRTRAPGRSP